MNEFLPVKTKRIMNEEANLPSISDCDTVYDVFNRFNGAAHISIINIPDRRCSYKRYFDRKIDHKRVSKIKFDKETGEYTVSFWIIE